MAKTNRKGKMSYLPLMKTIGKAAKTIGSIKGLHYTVDGIVALVRLPDGNAIEMKIKAARFSKRFPHYTQKTISK